jgi:hypothetical protein
MELFKQLLTGTREKIKTGVILEDTRTGYLSSISQMY